MILKTALLTSIIFLSPIAAADTYTIDPLHTHVLWHINHFGFSNPSGKWMATGTLEYDKNDLQKSQANVSIDLEKMIVGIPELEKHLKGKQFFDVETFPKATFKSNKVTVVDKKITEIEGKLTLHGVTHPVIIKVKQNIFDKNPVSEKPTIGFSGEASINRSDFGIRTLLPNLSDEVKLNIEVEAYKDSE